MKVLASILLVGFVGFVAPSAFACDCAKDKGAKCECGEKCNCGEGHSCDQKSCKGDHTKHADSKTETKKSK